MTSITKQLTPGEVADLLCAVAARIEPDANLLTLSWHKHQGLLVHVYDAPSFRRLVETLDLPALTVKDLDGATPMAYARGWFNAEQLTVVCHAYALVTA